MVIETDDIDITDPLEGTMVFKEVVVPLLASHIFSNGMRLSWVVNELCKKDDQRNAVISRIVEPEVIKRVLEELEDEMRRPDANDVWRTVVTKTAELWETDTVRMDEDTHESGFYKLMTELEKMKNKQFKKKGGEEELMEQILSIKELAMFMVTEVSDGRLMLDGLSGHAMRLKGLSVCPKCGDFHRRKKGCGKRD